MVDGLAVLGVSEAEKQWFAESFIPYLNDVIESAAKRAGVYFVDVEEAFAGHELCSENGSWANGIKAGNDLFVAFGQESFHPNDKGQAALHQALIDQFPGIGHTAQPAACDSQCPDSSSRRATLSGVSRVWHRDLDRGRLVSVMTCRLSGGSSHGHEGHLVNFGCGTVSAVTRSTVFFWVWTRIGRCFTFWWFTHRCVARRDPFPNPRNPFPPARVAPGHPGFLHAPRGRGAGDVENVVIAWTALLRERYPTRPAISEYESGPRAG